MATLEKNKKGSAKAKLSWPVLSRDKKGVEAWWGFLAGAIIVIVVAVILLLFYGKIKIGGEGAISGIMDKLGQMFK